MWPWAKGAVVGGRGALAGAVRAGAARAPPPLRVGLPLFAHSVPVHCTHSPHVPPWPGLSFSACLFTVYRCTRTHLLHPPPWSGLSFPASLLIVYRCTARTRRMSLPGL